MTAGLVRRLVVVHCALVKLEKWREGRQVSAILGTLHLSPDALRGVRGEGGKEGNAQSRSYCVTEYWWVLSSRPSRNWKRVETTLRKYWNMLRVVKEKWGRKIVSLRGGKGRRGKERTN